MRAIRLFRQETRARRSVNEGARPRTQRTGKRGRSFLPFGSFRREGMADGKRQGRKEGATKSAEGKIILIARFRPPICKEEQGNVKREPFFSRPAGENLSSKGIRRGKKLFRVNFLNFVFSSNVARFLSNTGNKLPISLYYGYIGLFFKVKAEKNDSL